jgi:hypothetical protein
MTLITFVDEEENATDLGETIAMLMRGHPSRAIVIRMRGGSDTQGNNGTLESRVFQQCWMPFGSRRQICCEQVEITATADHLADIRSIVSPLAVPDLPSVVWLRCSRLTKTGEYHDALALGEKIIVDSSRIGSPGLEVLTRFLDAGHMVGDLAWTRLTELRQLIAQLLGNRIPEKIEIDFPDSAEPPREAVYLFYWLIDAFPDGEHSLSNRGSGAGPISAVRIDDDIEIRLHDHSAEYRTGSLKQTANFKSGSDCDLLDEELGIIVHDRIFEQVLRKAAI